MTLPLNAIRAFAAVARHRGVRAAARELGVSHSSVSRHIAELERWLGVSLLDRDPGRAGFALTAQGERLARSAIESLQALETALDAGRESRSPFTVMISTTPSFASRWLLPRLPSLQRAHPRLEVSVIADQKLDFAERMSCDLALRMGRGPWPGLNCEPLMDDALYPVASPLYLGKTGTARERIDLRQHKLLHDRDPAASWAQWRKEHGPADLDVRTGPRFSNSDLVLRAAAQGLGVALARRQLAADDLASGALVRLLPSRQVMVKDYYWIITRPGTGLRHAVKAVMAWLRTQAGR